MGSAFGVGSGELSGVSVDTGRGVGAAVGDGDNLGVRVGLGVALGLDTGAGAFVVMGLLVGDGSGAKVAGVGVVRAPVHAAKIAIKTTDPMAR